MTNDLSLVWLRRDLRLEDNTAISKACAESRRVVVAFVFDVKILQKLNSKSDRRVDFIYDSIIELDQQLRNLGSRLIVLIGDPAVEIPNLANEMNATAVYFNEDYEPYAKLRDKKVCERLKIDKTESFASKDHVIFAPSEICKSDGNPYKMFTPYKNFWLKKLTSTDYKLYDFDAKKLSLALDIGPPSAMPSLKQLQFQPSTLAFTPKPGRRAALASLKKWSKHLSTYHTTRNFPADASGTSGLSVHLRFGTISIRECIRIAMADPSLGAKVWLSELIWRDFYHMILFRFPHVVNGAFKEDYDNIKWPGKDSDFAAWREGRTGYPIIDAGMRQLNQTGWMHNRLRMITASFLVKDLLIDWKRGESYFAEKLLDFDLAANNGGWQWCASTGCDSQPYFRIFNPVLQSQKFDPDCVFIKKWLPELKSLSAKEIHLLPIARPKPTAVDFKFGKTYPKAIVLHSAQKLRAIQIFKQAIKLVPSI